MSIKKRIKSLLGDALYGNKITFVIRIGMGALFFFLGFVKLFEPDAFALVIARYDMLPPFLAAYAAIIVPVLEMLLGLLLVIGYKTRAASFLSMLFMALFILFIGVNLARGRSFDCGCFDARRFGLDINETISGWLLLRDFVFLAALALIFRAERHLLSFEGYREKTRLKHLEKTRYQ